MVLALWECGSKALNHKLAIGITHLHLELRHKLSITRFPYLIFQLQSLRYFSIKSHGALMRDPKTWPLVLSRLSAKLETLKIASSDASSAILNFAPSWSPEQPSYITTSYIRGSSIGIDLSKLFPALQKLSLKPTGSVDTKLTNDLSLFACLPPSLAQLNTSYLPLTIECPQFFTFLPRSLQILRAYVSVIVPLETLPSQADLIPLLADIAEAPPALESIEFLDVYTDRTWPGTMKHGELRLLNVGPETLATLPTQLKALRISTTARHIQLGTSADWVHQLPVHLTTLRLEWLISDILTLGANINSLPRTLTSLQFGNAERLDWDAIQALPSENRWPPLLTNISCILALHKLNFVWIPHLPQSLRSLTVKISPRVASSFVPEFNLSEFPPSFTSLKIWNEAGSCSGTRLFGKHPSIRKLAASIPQTMTIDQETFEQLPAASLTTLSLAVDPSLDAGLLERTICFPSTLTHLELDNMHSTLIDVVPRSVTSLLLSNMRSLDVPSLISGMPAGLKYLTLQQRGDHAQAVADFSHLAHLHTLSLSSFGKFSSSILRTLSPKLTVLYVNLNVLDVADIPFIPPLLTSLNLGQAAILPDEMQLLGDHWPLSAPSSFAYIRDKVGRRLNAIDLSNSSSSTLASFLSETASTSSSTASSS